MRNCILFLFGSLLLIWGCQEQEVDYTKFVNPFVGTLNEGHCFPGATVPMGMVQVSPESTTAFHDGYCMDHVAGYQYTDQCLSGFTQTHLNGAGCPTLSDILLMPYSGREISTDSLAGFESEYDKTSEFATPGYYCVKLTDNNTFVELTATPHVAWHRYTFDHPVNAKILIDLQYGVAWDPERIKGNVIDAWEKTGASTISGYRKAREWAERDLYYIIDFDAEIDDVRKLFFNPEAGEKASRYLVSFKNNPKTVNIKIALSTTSVESAAANLVDEVGVNDSFDDIRTRAKDKWNTILSRVEAKGDNDRLSMIYTAIYHLYIQPNNIADNDGRYMSAEGKVMSSTDGKFMSTLSLWDTYRAAHPMYTILSPSLVPSLCSSIVDHYRTQPEKGSNPAFANRYLPRWALWGKETNTMIGNHAVPVLIDAYKKGLFPEDRIQELYEAVVTSLTKPHYRNHIELIDKYGYIPYDETLNPVDDSRETVARLLEGAYDFYCASLLAEDLGKEQDMEYFRKRSNDYKNVYDPQSGFMRGRNAKGEFKTNIDVNQVVGEWVHQSDFTEGNAWHYRFHVQHDVPGMISIMKGADEFRTKLDSMFYSKAPRPYVKDLVWNIYGTLGQYWHGNEPCHHVPYLYKYTDQGYKTDAILSYLVDNFSKNAPDGLKGNDDCGQMSAWYLFAVMGFYPVNPCGGEFILGAPQIPYFKIKLENGKTFEIIAENFSVENRFVEGVFLNGRPHEDISISYDDIMAGGKLVFKMMKRDDIELLHNFNL